MEFYKYLPKSLEVIEHLNLLDILNTINLFIFKGGDQRWGNILCIRCTL